MSARKALIVLTVFAVFPGSVAAGQEYRFVKMWPESPLGWCFYKPRSTAVDKAGNVYIADSGNHRIKKFDSKGRLLTQWGSAGKGEGQFAWLVTIRIDGSGVVYVLDADPKNPRLQKFTSDGQFIGEWKSEDFKSARPAPWDFALDSHGNLFVQLGGAYDVGRIAKFTPEGKLVAQWGGRGDTQGKFAWVIFGLEVDAHDNVYVADAWNHRVQKFDSTGKFLTQWTGVDAAGIALGPSGDVYVANQVGSTAVVSRFTPEGKFLARWETPGYAQAFPIAVDSSGRVYLTHLMGHCVDILDSDGKLIERWGSAGSDTGKFDEPGSIAVGPSGQVVVADGPNRRVQSFDSDGRVLARWGTGYYAGFRGGLAVDSSGNTYTIATFACNRMRKFDAEGRLVAEWGEEGSGDGQFKSPLQHIAADVSGNVYVADQGNHRVQKFSSDGKFLTKWGSKGTGDGQFTDMGLIAVDGSGDICVADWPESGQTRIQKFRPGGQFVTKWTVPCGAIMAVDLSDNVYNLSAWRTDGVIQKYDTNGKLVVSFGKPGEADDELGEVRTLCVDASGSIYVPQSEAKGCVKKFNAEGKFVNRRTWEPSLWRSFPAAIAVDKAGMVYVADWNTVWIQKLNPEGKPAGEFRLELSGTEGRFQATGGVAVDASASIYVVDSVDVNLGNPRIQKFDSKGEFITQWGGYGAANGAFKYPASIAVGTSGNAYVTDKATHCVHKFDLQGRFIKSWGRKGKEDGQFDDPEGIAVDKAGNVYVCDRQNCRLQKFDPEGKFLTKWGKEGSGDGEFHFPAAVALDKEGNVYVADSDNNRVQKFTADGRFLTQWGEFGEAPGQFSVPLGIAVDEAGNVYVSDSHNHRIQKFAPVRLP